MNNFALKNKGLQAARTYRHLMSAPGSRTVQQILRDKRGIKIYRLETTVFSDFAAARFGEAVKAQRILLDVNFSQQPTLQIFKLHKVNLAFEYRFLYALSGAFADFGDSAQPAPTFSRFGIHVVANDNQHGFQRPIKGR
jgi:hypothetical protein